MFHSSNILSKLAANIPLGFNQLLIFKKRFFASSFGMKCREYSEVAKSKNASGNTSSLKGSITKSKRGHLISPTYSFTKGLISTAVVQIPLFIKYLVSGKAPQPRSIAFAGL